jgi:hypothetical protein
MEYFRTAGSNSKRTGDLGFFESFYVFFAKKGGLLALKTAIFTPFSKVSVFRHCEASRWNLRIKGVVLMRFGILVDFWVVGLLQGALAGNYKGLLRILSGDNEENRDKRSEKAKKDLTNPVVLW